MAFVGKKRMYDVIGSVIATLVATLVINNLKSVLSFFNLEFQINLSVGLIAAVTIAFISVVVTVSLLKKRHNLELNMKGEQIKALKIKMLELEDISSKDSLTNTYNSNQVHRILGERIEKAKEKKQPFVGLLIDIDCFKKVNDNYGHAAGDNVLRQVASLIQPRSADDILIRYGGDEFLIFSKIGEQNGYGLGQRLKREVEDYEFWVDKNSQQRQKITISCGVCEFKLENTPEIFLEKLSIALMCAKKNEDGSDKKNFVAFID